MKLIKTAHGSENKASKPMYFQSNFYKKKTTKVEKLVNQIIIVWDNQSLFFLFQCTTPFKTSFQGLELKTLGFELIRT